MRTARTRWRTFWGGIYFQLRLYILARRLGGELHRRGTAYVIKLDSPGGEAGAFRKGGRHV